MGRMGREVYWDERETECVWTIPRGVLCLCMLRGVILYYKVGSRCACCCS
jgi:hypothetical protein